MNISLLTKIVEGGKIIWQKHALERMIEREITRDMVRNVLMKGEVIEDYPDDKPFPSALFLGLEEYQPIHVVCSLDSKSNSCHIVTAYKPDFKHFENDYRKRRK